MDTKDTKILAELAKNSRMPVQQIARKVGVSREVVTYRIKRFVEQGIIIDFYTTIDISALGYSRYGCLVQLRGISVEREKELLSWIVRHDFLTYASPLVGRWNLSFDIFARDQAHLKSVIQEILDEIREYLDSYIILPISIYESFPVKVTGESTSIKDYSSSQKIEIDEIDKELLQLLAKDARIEYREIAGKLRMTGNAIKYRIMRLQKIGVIKGYTIALDTWKLGYEFYNIQLKYLASRDENLVAFLRRSPQATYFYQSLGNENWNFDIGVVAKNSEELRAFLMQLREEVGTSIKIHDIYAIGEMIKSDHVPKGVFQ